MTTYSSPFKAGTFFAAPGAGATIGFADPTAARPSRSTLGYV